MEPEVSGFEDWDGAEDRRSVGMRSVSSCVFGLLHHMLHSLAVPNLRAHMHACVKEGEGEGESERKRRLSRSDVAGAGREGGGEGGRKRSDGQKRFGERAKGLLDCEVCGVGLLELSSSQARAGGREGVLMCRDGKTGHGGEDSCRVKST